MPLPVDICLLDSELWLFCTLVSHISHPQQPDVAGSDVKSSLYLFCTQKGRPNAVVLAKMQNQNSTVSSQVQLLECILFKLFDDFAALRIVRQICFWPHASNTQARCCAWLQTSCHERIALTTSACQLLYVQAYISYFCEVAVTSGCPRDWF